MGMELTSTVQLSQAKTPDFGTVSLALIPLDPYVQLSAAEQGTLQPKRSYESIFTVPRSPRADSCPTGARIARFPHDRHGLLL